MRKMRLRALTSTIVVLALGCTFTYRPGRLTEASAAMAASYDGDECARVLYQLSELSDNDYNSQPRTDDLTPESQVLLATCNRRYRVSYHSHRIKQWPRFHEPRPRQLVGEADPRVVDPILAAAAVLAVVRKVDEDAHSSGYVHLNLDEIAYARLWTQLVPPAQVDDALGRVQLPPEALRAFSANYRAAPSVLATRELDPAQEAVVLGVGVDVAVERREHYATYQPEYQRYDHLVAQMVTMEPGTKAVELIAAFEEVRDVFVQRCGADCRVRPLYAYTAARLAELHVLQGDALRAKAETEPFRRRGVVYPTYANELAVAQEEFVQHQRETAERYERAIESGVAEDTALQVAGGVGTRRIDRSLLMGTRELWMPDIASALEESRGVRPVQAEVQAARRDPGGARVTFARNMHEPTVVEGPEARELRRGDTLWFVSREGSATAIEVRRGEELTWVR